MPGYRLTPLDCQHWTFLLCFTSSDALEACQALDWLHRLPTLNVSIMFHTLCSHVRVQFDSIGLPTLNVSIAFYALRAMSGYSATPLDCPHWTFYCVLHVLAQFQGTDSLYWIAHIERFSFVLCVWGHARPQLEFIRLPTLNVSIAFYTLRRHAWLQMDSIGLPTLNVSIVFYMHWSHARVRCDYIGLPSLSVSIMFHMLWRHARVPLDHIG